MSQPIETLGLDEAMAVTLEYLREVASRPHGQRGMYGYDLWAPSVANAWAAQVCGTDTFRRENIARRASPVFFEAAWELCRRGLIRPGIRETGAQAVAGGCGYSLTLRGREALTAGDADRFVAFQPGALATAFAKFKDRFGDGYHQRCQEAIRCRDSEAWVAAMAMIGAAAESIVLATANARMGNKDAVLKAYSSATGRKKLFNDIAPTSKPHLARPLSIAIGLLNYWRDETSHNAATAITGPEVEQALRELLHLVQFVEDNWDELTSTAKASSKAAASAKTQATPQAGKVDEKTPPQVKSALEADKPVLPTSSAVPAPTKLEPNKPDSQASAPVPAKTEPSKVETLVKTEPPKIGDEAPSLTSTPISPNVKPPLVPSLVSPSSMPGGNTSSPMAPIAKLGSTASVTPTPVQTKPDVEKSNNETTSAVQSKAPEAEKTGSQSAAPVPTATLVPDPAKPVVVLPAVPKATVIGEIRPNTTSVAPAPSSGPIPLAASATPTQGKTEPDKIDTATPTSASVSVIAPSPVAVVPPTSPQTTSTVTPISAGIKSLMSWARSFPAKPEPDKVDAQAAPSVSALGNTEPDKSDMQHENCDPVPIALPEKISNHGG